MADLQRIVESLEGRSSRTRMAGLLIMVVVPSVERIPQKSTAAAYFARYVARQIVSKGLAKRAEIQVAYAIGVARPISVKVDTFGTGDTGTAVEFVKTFDFRPAAIIERLDLRLPIYRLTTNYGHFGRKSLKWEQ